MNLAYVPIVKPKKQLAQTDNKQFVHETVTMNETLAVSAVNSHISARAGKSPKGRRSQVKTPKELSPDSRPSSIHAQNRRLSKGKKRATGAHQKMISKVPQPKNKNGQSVLQASTVLATDRSSSSKKPKPPSKFHESIMVKVTQVRHKRARPTMGSGLNADMPVD